MPPLRHPRFKEPCQLETPMDRRYAIDAGRNYVIDQLRLHRPLSARDCPIPLDDNRRDLWFSAMMTELSDLLDVKAADRAAGRFTEFG